MNEGLLRYKKDAKICVFDFETEDLNLANTKPWQFACVVGTIDKITKEYDLFIDWEDLNMSKSAEQITRFDCDKWNKIKKDAKKTFTLINQIFEWTDYIIGHNIIGFDMHVYYATCYRLGLKPVDITSKILDTSCLIKGLPEKLDIPISDGGNLFEYQMKMYHTVVKKRGFATLGALCKLFDVEYDTSMAHDALMDVRWNYEAFKKLIWKINI
jgi:DNA polymerase III epsilon subunit-like protein